MPQELRYPGGLTVAIPRTIEGDAVKTSLFIVRFNEALDIAEAELMKIADDVTWKRSPAKLVTLKRGGAAEDDEGDGEPAGDPPGVEQQ